LRGLGRQVNRRWSGAPGQAPRPAAWSAAGARLGQAQRIPGSGQTHTRLLLPPRDRNTAL